MNSSVTENQLIIPDIADVMSDYTSIQLDIDERKIKAASLVAQNIDIDLIIGEDNLNRCINQDENSSDSDKALKKIIIAPLCYYTYSRCLLMFQGVLTDSGYIIEGDNEAESRNSAKSAAKEIKGVAESLMLKVIKFLEDENPSDTGDLNQGKLTPRVRSFGGKESRFNESPGIGFFRK